MVVRIQSQTQVKDGSTNEEPSEKKEMETLPATLPLEDAESEHLSAGAGLPVMVPLTVPEIRRLFFSFFHFPASFRSFSPATGPFFGALTKLLLNTVKTSVVSLVPLSYHCSIM